MDIAFGLGIFAWILQFIQKISISYTIPFIILIVGFFIRIKYTLREIKSNSVRFAHDLLFLFSFILLLISFGHYDGLLEYSNDFDSNFHHIVLAQNYVNHGSFFAPLWLRAPFIPQLNHSLYAFLLSYFQNDMLYLKVLNAVAFIQIYFLFVRIGTPKWRIIGVLFAFVVANVSELGYLFNTNMDALLGLFILAIFYLFYKSVRDQFTYSNLLLIIIFSGFAAGQKHFGLMFSFPILFLSGLLAFIEKFRSTHSEIQVSAISVFFLSKDFLKLTSIFSVFFLIFIPFYMHNLYYSKDLLFPFLGGVENKYGWKKEELIDFLGPTINHWGHRKDLLGFFHIPKDLILYPYDFQFFQQGGLEDFYVSTILGCILIIAVVSLLFYRKLKQFFFPAILLLISTFLWYKGSQVIRYLFPISLSGLLLGFLFSYENVRIKTVWLRNNIPTFLIVCFYCLLFTKIEAIRERIPINAMEHFELRSKIYGNLFSGNLRIQAEASNPTILEFGPQSAAVRSFFPNFLFCGDWFGGCAYNLFTHSLGPLRFREWDEIKKNVPLQKVDYISIYWTQFSGGRFPKTKEEYKEAFPNSVSVCLIPFYESEYEYSIYKVKKECQ
ncbi:hypothetical protein [Leptospira ryugenii]|nr:hypothetical protein [Leptospira ryugenii]